MDTGIKSTISFAIAQKKKREKYLGINLTKHVQDLYTENYTIQIKEIKDLNQWGDTS